MLSITIGMTGIAFSLPLGILLALGRRSDMLIVKSICVGFIEFIRGVPLITAAAGRLVPAATYSCRPARTSTSSCASSSW